MKTTITWVLWLAASMGFLLLTRNPIFLLISIIMLCILGARLAKQKQQPGWLVQNLRFLGTMVFLSALINLLFTHTGRTVFITLPENWPLIGGNLTLESLVYGAVNGLVIGALYLLFNIFNLALSIKQITNLIPRAFHPVAMMVTIALTFFPSVQQRTREIREAQLIRGNPMTKAADWLPIIMPLLVSSLEDAFTLSESMTARGFHARTGSHTSNLGLIGLLLAVFAIFSGWILNLYDYPGWLSMLLYLLGGGLVAMILFVSGRQSEMTRFRQETWQPSDKAAAALLSVALVTLAAFWIAGTPGQWAYSPYPQLALPQSHLPGILLSLIPGIPLGFRTHD